MMITSQQLPTVTSRVAICATDAHWQCWDFLADRWAALRLLAIDHHDGDPLWLSVNWLQQGACSEPLLVSAGQVDSEEAGAAAATVTSPHLRYCDGIEEVSPEGPGNRDFGNRDGATRVPSTPKRTLPPPLMVPALPVVPDVPLAGSGSARRQSAALERAVENAESLSLPSPESEVEDLSHAMHVTFAVHLGNLQEDSARVLRRLIEHETAAALSHLNRHTAPVSPVCSRLSISEVCFPVTFVGGRS